MEALRTIEPAFALALTTCAKIVQMHNDAYRSILPQTNSEMSGTIVVQDVEPASHSQGTKRVKGIPRILAEEERFANRIADSISPRLVPSIEGMPWRMMQVLAVAIYPGASRPTF